MTSQICCVKLKGVSFSCSYFRMFLFCLYNFVHFLISVPFRAQTCQQWHHYQPRISEPTLSFSVMFCLWQLFLILQLLKTTEICTGWWDGFATDDLTSLSRNYFASIFLGVRKCGVSKGSLHCSDASWGQGEQVWGRAVISDRGILLV